MKLHTESGAMTASANWPAGFDSSEANKFRSGVLDPNGGLWLIPSKAAAIIRFDTATGIMTEYDS